MLRRILDRIVKFILYEDWILVASYIISFIFGAALVIELLIEFAGRVLH